MDEGLNEMTQKCLGVDVKNTDDTTDNITLPAAPSRSLLLIDPNGNAKRVKRCIFLFLKFLEIEVTHGHDFKNELQSCCVCSKQQFPTSGRIQAQRKSTRC